MSIGINKRMFNQLVRQEVIKGEDVYHLKGKQISHVIDMAEKTYDLIGQRVSVHTNRNLHTWSLKSTDSRHKLLGYAFNRVLLQDVCWMQPTIGKARDTFQRTSSGGKGQRNVQAFAEGILVGVDSLVDESRLDLDLPAVRITYRPLPTPAHVGAFREIENMNVGVASSEYGLLQYTVPLGEHPKKEGSRRVDAIAFGEIDYIPEDHLKEYVDAITNLEPPRKRLIPYVSPNCKAYRKKR